MVWALEQRGWSLNKNRKRKNTVGTFHSLHTLLGCVLSVILRNVYFWSMMLTVQDEALLRHCLTLHFKDRKPKKTRKGGRWREAFLDWGWADQSRGSLHLSLVSRHLCSQLSRWDQLGGWHQHKEEKMSCALDVVLPRAREWRHESPYGLLRASCRDSLNSWSSDEDRGKSLVCINQLHPSSFQIPLSKEEPYSPHVGQGLLVFQSQ